MTMAEEVMSSKFWWLRLLDDSYKTVILPSNSGCSKRAMEVVPCGGSDRSEVSMLSLWPQACVEG